MKDYRALQIWPRSHQLTLSIYAVTKRFPASELDYLSGAEHAPLASEIAELKKMIGAFAWKLKADR